MKSNAGVLGQLNEITARLREQTNASRVTIRLDIPSRGFDVDSVVAEALTPSADSLKGDSSINQRQAATVKWLERERRPLIQNDLSKADPVPPAALVAVYKTKAQMLGPLVQDNYVFGWISVHYNDGPRAWQPADIAALERAIEQAHQEIGPV